MPPLPRAAPLAAALLLAAACTTPPALPDASPADAAHHADGPPPPDAAGLPDGRAAVGAACTADRDCAAGLRCDRAHPGGLCTRACKADADCGDAAHLGCRRGLCHARCNPHRIVSTCRAGYVCDIAAPSGLAHCLADCGKRACPAGRRCETRGGHCYDPKGKSLGAACTPGKGECTGTPNSVCFAALPGQKPFCTVPCAPFTLPCPRQIVNAACVLGGIDRSWCAYVCTKDRPVCPLASLKCVTWTTRGNLCLPK